MGRLRIRFAAGTAAVGVAVLLLVGSAQAATVEGLSLDSYHAWNKDHTPAVRTEGKLKRNHLYVATVSGTFSYYGAINYVVPQAPWTTLCGTPEAEPEFPSAGGSGPVGFDSEFVFARPWTPEACAAAVLPVRWTNFQMKDGGEWAHPEALNVSDPPAPNPDHSYEYAIVGQKKKVGFRLFDIRTRDNYGTLRISIRTATAADCAGSKFEAFGFATEGECVAQT